VRALAGPLTADALAELRAHARDHALTLVGLVWGAASVVLLLSLGEGFFTFLDLGFKKTGDRYSFVDAGYTSSESGGARPGRRIWLEREDYERIRAAVPAAAAVAAEFSHGAASVRTPRRTRTTAVSGGTPELARIQVLRVARGRFYDEADDREARRVAVLGANLVPIFFGGADPLGRSLEIEGRPFRVIGVLEKKGAQLVMNNALHDDMVFVPLSAAQRAFGAGDRTHGLAADPRRRDLIDAMHGQIRAALFPRHHIRPDDTEAVRLQSITEFTAGSMAIAAGLRVILGLVGAGTLALAGVGVANLMIALVSRRRVELAVRRACGARTSDVVLQILLETVVVVLAGGALGALAGAGIAMAIELLPRPEMVPAPRVSPSVLVTTFGVLFATGVLAGVAPARLASRVDPGVALRVT
jgi:putative ABC transport system permease protein